MTALVLDAGALTALDRNDRSVWAMLRNAADDVEQVLVSAGVIAQAWCDGSRQALLARALAHCDEVPLEGTLARATGQLCGRADTADIVDASVALVAAARSRNAFDRERYRDIYTHLFHGLGLLGLSIHN